MSGMTREMAGRTVVITGGNSGIGLETAVGLAARGARIILGCRNQVTGRAALEEITTRTGNTDVALRELDLADLRSVEAFADGLRSELPALHVLVNNAGLIHSDRRETAQGVEATFGINHLGPFHLTNLLTGLLAAAGAPGTPARIVNVASVAHWFAFGGMSWSNLQRERGPFLPGRVYGESKLANILHARHLATRLGNLPVVAHAVHPGVVRSGFGKDGDMVGIMGRIMPLGDPFMISPERGARTSIHVATSAEAARTTGLYWVRCRPRSTAPWANDDAASRLWDVSEQLIGSLSVGDGRRA